MPFHNKAFGKETSVWKEVTGSKNNLKIKACWFAGLITVVISRCSSNRAVAAAAVTRRGKTLSRITDTCNKSDPHFLLLLLLEVRVLTSMVVGQAWCYDLSSALALIAIYAFSSLMSSQLLFSETTFVRRFSFLQLPIPNINLALIQTELLTQYRLISRKGFS